MNNTSRLFYLTYLIIIWSVLLSVDVNDNNIKLSDDNRNYITLYIETNKKNSNIY